MRLTNPHELHYGSPQGWVTTGVGTVIVGGARLGYGSEASGGEYLCEIGGRRLWAKEWCGIVFFRHLILKITIVLPRQARDKQKESTQHKDAFSSGSCP